MFEYTEEDGIALLNLARQSISSHFNKEKPIVLEGKQFKQARGVFVTITKLGELRGCIGFPYPNMPIQEAVIEAAKAAAFQDPRFSPLHEKELKEIKIEISILTYPQQIETKIKNIEIGKDGLMCEFIGYSGLLLPQVATEYNFSPIQFLECLCQKAGIPKDSWQNSNFKLQKFQCQIFKED